MTKEVGMSSVMFAIFFLLVAATGFFYFAPDLVSHGNPVAADICSMGRQLCQHAEYTAIAAGGAGLLWLILRVTGR